MARGVSRFRDDLITLTELKRSVKVFKNLNSLSNSDYLDKRKELINLVQSLEIVLKKFLIKSSTITSMNDSLYHTHDVPTLFSHFESTSYYKSIVTKYGITIETFNLVSDLSSDLFVDIRYKQSAGRRVHTINLEELSDLVWTLSVSAGWFGIA